MPTDREIEESTLLRQFQPPDTSGTPTPSVQDIMQFISRLRDDAPSVERDTPLQPTPITPVMQGSARVIPKGVSKSTEATDIYIPVNDSKGNPIVIYSTTGEGRSAAEYAQALRQYNAGKGTPAGFTALPQGSLQERMRTGFEKGPGTFARETLPNIGEAVGGSAALSPLLLLAQKAGLISPSTANTPINAGRTAGRATGKFIGEQFDTPGEAGMAGATAAATLASGGGAPVLGASGEFLKQNFLKNMVGMGLSGVAGSTLGKVMTGEEQTLNKASQEFATAALSNGVQGVASYWLTRYLKPDTATKAATEMMDAIKKKYPTLLNDPDAFNIANASPKDISNLTSMMSKALRGDIDDEAKQLVESLKGTLLHRLTTSEQATLRASSRRLIEAQNNVLDNIGDDITFNKALPAVREAKEGLLQYVRSLYPNVKKIDPTIVRAEGVLSQHSDFADTFREGAEVLHYLKKSGAGKRFDEMRFAQEIRGEYTKDPNSLLNEIGKILGQGRSLKDLPLPGSTPPLSEGALKGKNVQDFLKNLIPGAGTMERVLRTNSTPTPWGPPSPTGLQRPLPSIAAQEAGQSAIRSFLNTSEKK